MAATVSLLSDAEVPVDFEDLRPHPSFFLAQGPPLEGMRLTALRALAADINETLPAAARISDDAEPAECPRHARPYRAPDALDVGDSRSGPALR